MKTSVVWKYLDNFFFFSWHIFFFLVSSVVREQKKMYFYFRQSNQSARRAPRQNPARVAGNVGGWRGEHFPCASGRPPGWCSSPAARPPAASPCRAPEPRTHTPAAVKGKKENSLGHTLKHAWKSSLKCHSKYHQSARHQNKIGTSFKIR